MTAATARGPALPSRVLLGRGLSCRERGYRSQHTPLGRPITCRQRATAVNGGPRTALRLPWTLICDAFASANQETGSPASRLQRHADDLLIIAHHHAAVREGGVRPDHVPAA